MNSSRGSFDHRRLTLARWDAGLTKRDLAERAGVSAASVTQYEAGKTQPAVAVIARLSLACGVSQGYLLSDRNRRRPDLVSRSFFRSLRSTSQRERDRADAKAEHVFDVVDTLEQSVNLPPVSVPTTQLITTSRAEIEQLARKVRQEWGVPDGPVANVVRLLEAHGVVVARLASNAQALDAFSRWFGDRPLVVLWSDKGDKARSRFDAAHELGHLVMHSDAEPLSQAQEREANMFASAFLMPTPDINRDLVRRSPTQRDWPTVLTARSRWGVSAKALLYRSRELGALSEAAFRRSMQNYQRQGMQLRDGIELGEPEQPVMLRRAMQALELSEEGLASLTSLRVAQVSEAVGGFSG